MKKHVAIVTRQYDLSLHNAKIFITDKSYNEPIVEINSNTRDIEFQLSVTDMIKLSDDLREVAKNITEDNLKNLG